jgi:DNA-binding transcriptional LysR family regulator
MDTQTLRWFQLVADGVTLTDVSSREHTTQPGVSRALARLEAEIGTPLLRRSGRTLRMTHAGVAFKRHVDALMHELDDGLAAVHELVDPETGTVTLAFQPSLGSWLVPDLIAGFRVEHPGVRFDLRPKRDEHVTTVSARGEIDLELSTLGPVDPALRWRPLARQPLVLAVPVAHPLAGRARVALAEVAGEPFVTIRPSSLLRRQTDALWARTAAEPEVAFECDDIATMTGFVAAGLGLAVVPAAPGALPRSAAERLCHLDLEDADAMRQVGVTWSPQRRLLPAAELFRAYVVDRAASGLLSGLADDSGPGAVTAPEA